MSVASKNPFDLLGNDDGDAETPSGPVKTVDKSSTRTAKRNTDGEAPAKAAATTGRRPGFTGSEAAYRDRGAGTDRNRVRTTDDGNRGGGRGSAGGAGARVRGGRGARHPRDRDDRHSKGVPGGSERPSAGGWGATEGEAEMKDEQAGEEIAKKEERDGAAEDVTGEGDARDETPTEPEDKNMSYADYLAQQAEKKLALESENALKVRKANEGSKSNKQWAAAKPLVKEEDDDFISGTGGKAKRERERKVKQVVEIDNRYVEPERTRGGGRGGRGGGRGEGRGEGRGDSSRGGPRGEGRGDSSRGGPRGEGRGDSSRGGPRGGGAGRGAPRGDFRGDFRGGRGAYSGGRGGGDNLNTKDEKAFPTLGS